MSVRPSWPPATAAVAGLAQGAIYAAGALLIQKVLGPKRPKPSASDASPVYTIGAARNQPRPYQPLPLLLGGPLRIAPDVASNPYTWYEADDQYLAMTLTAGINVGRVEALYNGDALLSSFEGVTVWHNGFSEMPSEAIRCTAMPTRSTAARWKRRRARPARGCSAPAARTRSA